MQNFIRENGIVQNKSGVHDVYQMFHESLPVSPTKPISEKVIRAFNYWLKISEEKMTIIKDLVQDFQKQFEILDDFRNSSAVQRKMSEDDFVKLNANTLNYSTYFYFASYGKATRLNHADAVSLYNEYSMEVFRGLGMEVNWRNNYVCPTEDQYRHMANRKTKALFNMTVALMQLFSTNKTDFTKLLNALGTYFQIRDDYKKIYSQKEPDTKVCSDDVIDGRLSLPVIHAINNLPEENTVLNILKQRTTAPEVKKYFVSLLEKTGSFSYTRHVMEEMDEEARAEVKRLGGNQLLVSFLDELLDWKEDTCNSVPEP